jgi:hypothetical protein
MKWRQSFNRIWGDQRGSVESALVLIPLLVLFLIGMQISLAIHARNVGRIEAQNSASVRAISGDFEEGDSFIHIESSGDSQNLDLLITRREDSVQDLIPGFLGGVSAHREIGVEGLAIVENSR